MAASLPQAQQRPATPRRERETAQVVPLRRASAPARAEPDVEAALHEFLRALLAATGPDPAPSPPAP